MEKPDDSFVFKYTSSYLLLAIYELLHSIFEIIRAGTCYGEFSTFNIRFLDKFWYLLCSRHIL